MNTYDTYYPDLITRYLSGEALPEEISELSTWIGSSAENASFFDEFRKAWHGVKADQVEQQVDPAKEWELLLPKLTGFGGQGTGIRDPRFEIRDLESPNPHLTTYNPQPTTYNLQPTTHNPQPTTYNRQPKVIQMETNRLPWQVVMIRASLIAAIALVLLIPAWVAYRYFTSTEITRLSASSEVLEALLPDGSMISLNSYSTVTYTDDYGKNNRDVTLNGEGYFEVNRDSLLPFVISCGNSRLEVLGTSFFVHAEQDAGDMAVVLVDGSVTVYFKETRSTGKTIIPGEKAELIHANQRIIVSPNEDPNFLAWKTFHLIFLDDRLDMIIKTLNKVYQANISLADERLASCRLTASFDQQELGSVLSVIEATLDLRSETNASAIILYGKGCN